MAVKTDRRDARGIAQLLRMGWYRPVHRKSASSQEVRLLLAARKQMQGGLIDLEQTTRGLLRGFGLKMGETTRGRFEHRVLELVAGHAALEQVMRPLLRARDALRRELADPHKQTLAVAREDAVCRRLMTVPGVGAVVSLTYRAGVDDPNRFAKIESALDLFRTDAQALSVGRDRHRGQDHQGRRRWRAQRALRGGERAAHVGGAVFVAETLGDGSGQTARAEAREGRAGAQARRRAAPHPVDGSEFGWGKEDTAAGIAA